MARKTKRTATEEPDVTASAAESPSSSSLSDPLSSTSTLSFDRIKVNNSNLKELKHTCDDAVKLYFSKPGLFAQDNTHTDVRLALGWTSAIVAGGASLYGYRIPFQESKFWVTVGVGIYLVLSGIMTLYAMFVEGDVIFVGKRRSLAKRIMTERLTVSSSVPAPPPRSYFSFSSPPASTSYPSYSLVLSYSHSANNGKSVIRREEIKSTQLFSAYFDPDGNFWNEGFDKTLEGLISGAMGPGVEDKEE